MMRTLWTRDYSLHRMEQVARSLIGDRAQRWLGLSVTATVSTGAANGLVAFQVDDAQWNKALQAQRRLLADPRKFSQYLREYSQARRAFLTAAKHAGEGAIRTKDTVRLAEFLKEFNDAHDRFMLTGQWMPYYLAELSERLVQDLARRHLKDAIQRQAAIAAVFTPDRMTAIRKERVELLRIAGMRSVRERQQRLVRHHSRYCWLPCINYFGSRPWTMAFFRQTVAEARRSEDIEVERRAIQNTYARNRRLFRACLTQFPRSVRPVIQEAHELTFLKDDRDDVRRQSYFLARPLYGQIARVLGLPAALVEYLTMDEMRQALRNGDHVSRKVLTQRRRGYVLRIVRGQTRITLKPQSQLDSATKPRSSQTLTGTVACGGQAVGVVRIVLLTKDISRVRPGDILVAVSTHPDYLPAMRRAAAFVTDEGGLTSHAAIVAREMHKPCIVGTKHATRLLKNGDRVEVDAIKGIVRKV